MSQIVTLVSYVVALAATYSVIFNLVKSPINLNGETCWPP